MPTGEFGWSVRAAGSIQNFVALPIFRPGGGRGIRRERVLFAAVLPERDTGRYRLGGACPACGAVCAASTMSYRDGTLLHVAIHQSRRDRQCRDRHTKETNLAVAASTVNFHPLTEE